MCCGNRRHFFFPHSRQHSLKMKPRHCLAKWPLLREAWVRGDCIYCVWEHILRCVWMICGREEKRRTVNACEWESVSCIMREKGINKTERKAIHGQQKSTRQIKAWWPSMLRKATWGWMPKRSYRKIWLVFSATVLFLFPASVFFSIFNYLPLRDIFLL